MRLGDPFARRTSPEAAAPVVVPTIPATPTAAAAVAWSPSTCSWEDWLELRGWIAAEMVANMKDALRQGRTPENLRVLEARFNALCAQRAPHLTPDERQQMWQQALDELFGFGPIQPLLDDDTVTEVMVNGPQQVFVERKGRISLSGVRFNDDEHIVRVIERIIVPLGRTIGRVQPMVDARLPDGSRVNAVIPPAAVDHPGITIRKFSRDKLKVKDLVAFGSITEPMAEFLRACVVSRLNILISGGTGSGKTTLLNILSGFIPEHERIVTIEDAAELQLQQPHVYRMEAQPPDANGQGQVLIRDLVRNSLRMRPDRIVVGECRGGEALDMLQAMNTGHDGSLTTIHANTPRDTIARLETLVLMAGFDLPVVAIRRQIASAIDLIVQQQRLRDGSRKVTNITEINGMESDVVVMQDIFTYREQGTDENGKVLGQMMPTGVRPRINSRLEMAGFHLPPEMFLSGMPMRSWPSPRA